MIRNRIKNAMGNHDILMQYVKEKVRMIPYYLTNGKAWPPNTIYIIINSVCNCKCKMCDIGQKNTKSQFYKTMNKGTEIPIKKFKKIIDEIKDFNPEIAITSTEPLLYKDIIKAIKYVKNSNLKCSVTTNGLLLKKYADKLVQSELDTLNISIDGPREIHQKIRGVRGIFEEIKKGLDIILEYDERPRLRVNTTITEFNFDHLYETAKIIYEWGIDYHYFTHLNFITEEMAEYHNKVIQKYLVTSSCITGTNPQNIDIKILLEQINNIKRKYKNVYFVPNMKTLKELAIYYYEPKKFIDGYDRCLIPWKVAQIAANGDLIVSTRCFNINFGNLYEQKFDELWNGVKMIEFRKNLKKYGAFPACTRCCGVF